MSFQGAQAILSPQEAFASCLQVGLIGGTLASCTTIDDQRRFVSGFFLFSLSFLNKKMLFQRFARLGFGQRSSGFD
jgi:hypothetical protein